MSLNSALQNTDFENPLLLILCSDIIQSVAFENNLYENLYKVDSAADRILFTIKAAIEAIANSQISSLHLAVSVAFVREFLCNLSRKLFHDMQHNQVQSFRILYQNVNAVLENQNAARMFLLKQLKLNKTLKGLHDLVVGCESVLSCLVKIPFPEDEPTLV